jgi:hypothetical protein
VQRDGLLDAICGHDMRLCVVASIVAVVGCGGDHVVQTAPPAAACPFDPPPPSTDKPPSSVDEPPSSTDSPGYGGPGDELPRDAGLDAMSNACSSGTPSCATIAEGLCERLVACVPSDAAAGMCFAGYFPGSICVESVVGCKALFSRCHPTSTLPMGHLTIMPNPAACLAALPSAMCIQQGEDEDFYVPDGCLVCPPPWEGFTACSLFSGDAG